MAIDIGELSISGGGRLERFYGVYFVHSSKFLFSLILRVDQPAIDSHTLVYRVMCITWTAHRHNKCSNGEDPTSMCLFSLQLLGERNFRKCPASPSQCKSDVVVVVSYSDIIAHYEYVCVAQIEVF